MHVVALNWRDLKNPRAGGAEVHMEEILRYLGHHGHRCTLITSRFPGAAAEEDADGYRIVRGGHEYDFFVAVPLLYRRVAAECAPDIVLDDINKIPFYSPLFVRAPVLAVVPHLMGEAVFHEATPVVAAAVYALERPVRLVYRRCHFEVISESTRQDLLARGFAAERITVVLCGVDREVYRSSGPATKSPTPSIALVGRLRRYKAIDHALRALVGIRRSVPDCTLTIIGEGSEQRALERLTARLGLERAVRFVGFVPTAEKVRLLQQAHVVLNCSVREGWGLTNVEANACGTVCVAADSPGLRDSVLDGRTGLLYPYGDLDALTAHVVRLLTNPSLRTAMELAALEWAASLTWERCGRETLALIERVRRLQDAEPPAPQRRVPGGAGGAG